MDIKELSRIHRALSNKKRLMIIKFLSSGKEETTGTIAQELKMPYQTVVRHIKILESVGVVKCRRAGLNQLYCLTLQDRGTLWSILKPTLDLISKDK